MAPTIDLQSFCSHGDDAIRYDTHKPFVFDGWLYATDCRICIRVPTTDPTTDGKYPRADRLFTPFAGTFTPLPEIQACESCRFAPGPHKETCDGCGGDGMCDRCPCEKPHTCGVCQGTGQEETYCDCRVEILPGLDVEGRYYGMLKTLPGAKIGHHGTETDPIRIVFDGGEGLLMPMKLEKK